MKNLAIFSAVVALALLAKSASALTNGWESVQFHAIVHVQDGDVTKVVTVNTKDLLYLVEQEFGSLPNGAKLVSYGMDDEEFAVLTKNNDIYIYDASRNEEIETNDDYELYPFASEDEDAFVYDEGHHSTLFRDAYCGLHYQDATDTYTLHLLGRGKIQVDFENDDETYNIHGDGTCYLPSGDLKGKGSFGVFLGSLKGSGKDVDAFETEVVGVVVKE
jgi:hypothetical protein